MRTLIVTPTYNERENIETLLRKVSSILPAAHVLVVDDNSPDGTGDYIGNRAKDEAWIHLLARDGKLGLGTAYCAGFKWAIEHDYEVVIQMDADLSHNPDQLPIFMSQIEEHDLIIGSRYIKGVNVVNWPLSRLILSWSANIYAKVVTGIPIADLTGGFKCWRIEVLRAINIDTLNSEGYGFQIETTFRAFHEGYNIHETPIIFIDRVVGESKMSGGIIMEAVWLVISLKLGRIKRWFNRGSKSGIENRGSDL